MTKRASSEPNHTPRIVAGKAKRADRLAAEMRRNLLKRKHQQREKSAESKGESCGRSRSVVDD